jgi:hypothetical protein
MVGAFNADRMALEWCQYVDGKTIFPKLPVYLRAYFDKYLRNRRVKDAVSGMKSDIELLEQLNKELVPKNLLMQQDQGSTTDAPIHGVDDDVEAIMEEKAAVSIGPAGWPQIPLPSTMCPPELIARRSAGLGPPIVEGTMIGLVKESSDAPLKRGGRGNDTKRRKKRRCVRCLQNKGDYAGSCKGGKAGGKTKCEHFHETGELRMGI